MIVLQEKPFKKITKSSLKFLSRLSRDTSGLALTEFAYSLPIFMSLGMFGLETAHLATNSMRVSQATLNLSDNASRMGQSTNAIARTVFENDINQVFTALRLQAGDIDILQNGRIILSSLEQNDDGGQWIHWQRCKGLQDYPSRYGVENTGETGTSFAGMGVAGSEVTASLGTGVMFVEVMYVHKPLFGNLFFEDRIIRHEAVFNVRDTRNLTVGVGNDGKPSATCDLFTDI